MGRTGGLAHADLFADRYRLDRVLKRSAGVETLLVNSVADGSPVVIKRTPSRLMSAALGMRLAHEATVLSELTGTDGQPYLIDHGVDDGWIWLAQRFLEGETLASKLEGGPIGLHDSLVVAASVLRTLVLAHEVGVVHRDVKPANILVQGAETISSASLIDFGLSRSISLDQAIRDNPVGTARYCSPEQAGLIEVPVDGRSDVYSVGTTLFECLSGAPLFGATDIRTVLHQKIDPIAMDSVRSAKGVPRAVSELLYRMLRPHPDDRYQSAAAALFDVEEIQKALVSGGTPSNFVVGRNDHRGSLAEPSFVGRAAELGTLLADLDQTAQGNGKLVILEGESGAGKSRLLDELATRAVENGFLVLRGQGEDRTVQRPFRIFDGVVQGIVSAASQDRDFADRFATLADGYADTLLAVVPRLGEILPGGAGNKLPEEYAQSRSVSALAAMLDAAAEQSRPALVVLDDCQWGQAMTAEVLSTWASQTGARRWVSVVAAFRADRISEINPADPFLSLESATRLRLSPLTDTDIVNVLTSMAGRLPSPASGVVVRLCEGNPFMAQAVLRGMVETAALIHSESGWDVDKKMLGQVETSRRAALVLARRLDMLAPSALLLLQAGAVLGKSFDLDLALAICRLHDDGFLEAVDEVRSRRILWVDADGRHARFFHDKLREAVLEGIDDDRRKILHLRAAAHLSSSQDPNAFDLAYHYDAGGRPDRALPHAVIAAERSRAQHALDDAEFYYRVALNSFPDRPLVARLADGLGEVLALAGRYDEAEAQFATASANAADDVFRAAITGKVGEVEFRKGDQAKACAHLQAALRELGRWVPRTSVTFFLAALWEIIVQAVHTILPLYPRRKRPAPQGSEKLALRFYSRLAYTYWFHKGRIPCLWAHLREMNIAERYGSSPELAQAYSEHAPAMSMLPWFSRGIDYAERSLFIRQKLGDLWGQGQSLSFQGVVLYSASRFEEAIECCREAVRLLEPTGDQWEINTASWHVALSHYRLGRLGVAASKAAEVHRRSERIGDMAASGISLSAWSRAAGGRLDGDPIAIAMSRENEDLYTTAEICLAEGVRLIASGQPREAAAMLGKAWRDVKAAGLRQEYVAPLPAWWATALRAEAELVPTDDPRGREVRNDQMAASKVAVKWARSYRNNLPHALRELALAEVSAGRLRAARQHLKRSITVAAAQDARWEESKSREHLAEIGAALGWSGAAADLGKARSAVREMEAGAVPDGSGLGDHLSASLSLAARFSTLLDTGRTLAAASNASAVYAAVSSAVGHLLGADRCHVLEIDDGDFSHLLTVSGEELEGISASAVKEAVETRQVVTRVPANSADVTDSLELSGVKSLLCAPILCNERVVACFYAVHKEIGELFGDVECQLAKFVTTLAGATLEHVSGDANRYRALVEHSSDVTFLSGADGVTRYASPAVSSVLGWTPDEIIGTTNASRVHPDDLGDVASRFRDVVTSPGSSHRLAFRIEHKDGSWRHVEATYTNRLHDPAVGAVVVNIHDVTERRLAERRLERVAEQFRLAFDNAPIGMALIGRRDENDERFIRVNDALANMLGYERRDLETMSARELTHPDDRKAAQTVVGRSLNGDGTDVRHAEQRFLHSSGRWVWVSLHTGLVRDELGAPDYSVTQVVDITGKMQADAALKHQAYTDPLTRLDNRWLFLDRVPQSLARARRRGTNLAVLYLDIDNFKVINDSHGHAAGDRVLEEIASRLRSVTREEDILARLGGDEFVLVVDDLQEREEVKEIATRIDEILRRSIEVGPGMHVKVTASLGITVAGLDDDAQSLLRDADIALYRAKDRGKARFEIFGEHLRIRALARERSERELRSAIDEHRLVLHYQPIVDLHNEGPVAVEALVRYQGPEGLVYPASFIRVAEETGLIVPIGTWVIEQACRDLPKLRDLSRNPDLHVGVNVSPRQLADPDFASSVAKIIDIAGVDPKALAIEITEHALIDMVEPARRCLERPRQVGCTTGIDDFGTGYSSLVLITRLPLDFLKIDQTFVKGIGLNRDSEAIVRALVGLSQSLGLVVKAEGVETREQADALRGFGCDRAQGYLFSRPLPVDELFL